MTDSSLDAALVVAADGALSPTRKLLGLRTREWDYGHRAIVTTVQFSDSHRCTAWQRFCPRAPRPAAACRPDERLCSIVWSIDEDRADALLQLDDDEFGRALTRGQRGRPRCGHACAPRLAFPLRQRHAVDYVLPAPPWSETRRTRSTPWRARASTSGLPTWPCWPRSSAGRPRAASRRPLEVLRRYQRQRKGDNLRMMAAMDGFKRLFEQDALPLRWLRNTGMRGVAAAGRLKRRIIREAMGVA
jgi:2-octaprenylphenol hydroxylase